MGFTSASASESAATTTAVLMSTELKAIVSCCFHYREVGVRPLCRLSGMIDVTHAEEYTNLDPKERRAV